MLEFMLHGCMILRWYKGKETDVLDFRHLSLTPKFSVAEFQKGGSISECILQFLKKNVNIIQFDKQCFNVGQSQMLGTTEKTLAFAKC